MSKNTERKIKTPFTNIKELIKEKLKKYFNFLKINDEKMKILKFHK